MDKAREVQGDEGDYRGARHTRRQAVTGVGDDVEDGDGWGWGRGVADGQGVGRTGRDELNQEWTRWQGVRGGANGGRRYQ